MTISDIEYLTGMTRANIRFYEEQGFISPERASNGYRNYVKEDVEVLKRIKLLRTLHLSLEEIKALHSGEENLVNALDKHLEKLAADKTDIETSERICRSMRADNVSFNTFDAQKYLDKLIEIFETPVEELEADCYIPYPIADTPIRRFLARALDIFIYWVLWMCTVSLRNIDISARSAYEQAWDFLIPVFFMLVFEPLLLCLFGTTIGKGILGLHVMGNTGKRLSYVEAFKRTMSVFLYGFGLYVIPIVKYYRLFKCFKASLNGEDLAWEYDSYIVLKDERMWRNIVYGFMYIVMFILFMACAYVPLLAKNTGDITIGKFSENYNRFLDYYNDSEPSYYLDRSGNITDNYNGDYNSSGSQNSAVVIISSSTSPAPDYSYITDNQANGIYSSDDIMKGLYFSIDVKGDQHPDSYHHYMKMAMWAFIKAQDGYLKNNKEVNELIDNIPAYESFSFTICGVTVTCNVEYDGYNYSSPNKFLYIKDDAEDYAFYRLSFSMVKN